MATHPEALTYSVAEAARLLGVSERHLRNLIGRGELPVLRLGQRTMIPKVVVARLVERAQ